MTITNLTQQLRSQLEDKKAIVLDSSILSNDELDRIRSVFGLSGNAFLTVKNIEAIPNAKQKTITIEGGQCDLLKSKKLPTSLQLSVDGSGTVQLIFQVLMPDNWVFKKSFPDLDLFPFNQLDLRAAGFIYATQPSESFAPWSDQPQELMPLEPGLNFASWMLPGNFGVLRELLGNILEDGPQFKFFGPFNPDKALPYPLASLQCPIGDGTIDLAGKFSMNDPGLLLEINPPEGALQSIDLYARFQAQDLEFKVGIPAGGELLRFITAPAPGSAPVTSARIGQIPGVENFASYIPEPVRNVFENIALRSFSVDWSLSSRSITSLQLEIGTPNPWQVIPGIALTGLVQSLSIIQPFSGTGRTIQTSLTATAALFPHIFPGPFAFNISLEQSGSGWQMSDLSGFYFGSVGLADLLNGLTDNKLNAGNDFNAIRFADLGVRINYPARSYALVGTTSFNFPLGETEFAGGLVTRIDYREGAYILDCTGTTGERALPVGELFQYLSDQLDIHISLPEAVRTLGVDQLSLQLNTKTRDFALSGMIRSSDPGTDQAAAQWTISLGVTDLEIGSIHLALNRQNGKTGGIISGSAGLFGAELVVEAELADELELRATAGQVSITRIVETLLHEVDLPDELPDISFDQIELLVSPTAGEFSLTAKSLADWEIPVGVIGIALEDLQMVVQRKAAGTPRKYTTSGSLMGGARIGTVTTSLVYNFPGDFIFTTKLPEINLSPVIQDLCGAQAMMGLSIPDNIAQLKFTDITVTASPSRKFFSLSGSSTLGSAELIINKNRQGKWAFIAGFAPPATWHFSALDASLQPLDSLRMDNVAMVLSSAPDRGVPLSVIQLPDNMVIQDGLTFFAALDLTDLGVKDLMSIDKLVISTNIDRNPANIRLAASIGGTFKISEAVSMGNMEFFLQPFPGNFQLGISGSVFAQIDTSDLQFIGTMSVKPIERSASFAATMLGFWNEPFGIKGLALGDVAMTIGIGIVPPPAVALPIVGLAGTMTIGTVTGSAAVKFDAANPIKSMIAASFNRLYLREVILTFCDPLVYNQIPAEIRNSILTAGLEDVGIYVVPQPTNIGELYYEQGFRFEGKLSVAGFNASFFFLLSYSEGFAVKASMDPIRIDDVFELTGVGNYPGPTLDIDLRLGGKPGILIAGLVRLLGVQAQTLVSVSDQGFTFFVEGKIFDLFIAGLTVTGGNFKGGGDFAIQAAMRNDLLAYLRENARKAIQDAADSATRDIQHAQNAVDAKQREGNKLNQDIANMKATVEAERARHSQAVKSAEQAVSAAQAQVNKIQGDIDRMYRTIQAERARDTQKLRDAQAEVTKAQQSVNGLQDQINSAKHKIDQLNADIKAKKKWYDNSGWRKSYRWAEYSAYVTAKGTEITALYTKIGTLEAAKATAVGVLEAAKQVVRGIELGAKTFPIEADPRMAALYTAKATANAGLETAKQSLKAAQALIKTFPVEADPRVAGLYTLLGTATAGLQSARLVLEGVKQTVGGLATVGDFIVKYGLGGLVDVKEAHFAGKLNVLKGGNVNMGLKLVLLNNPHDMSLAFNFNDLAGTLKRLTDKLLAEIK